MVSNAKEEEIEMPRPFFGKQTYAFYQTRGEPVKHKLLGKTVYYRPYSTKVVEKYLGTKVGKVIAARRLGKGHIVLAVKSGRRIGYVTARMVTTVKPKKRKRKT